jgi:hypothetical protein
MTTELTKAESLSLKAHEGVIERGLNTFIEVGNALFAIREERLYRESHKTFEAYCQERWGKTRDWAYRLIRSAEAASDVEHVLQVPLNARQAEAVAKVPGNNGSKFGKRWSTRPPMAR